MRRFIQNGQTNISGIGSGYQNKKNKIQRSKCLEKFGF